LPIFSLPKTSIESAIGNRPLEMFGDAKARSERTMP
jgi:hypothetical protein